MKKQIITVFVSVLSTLIIVFGVLLGIKLFKEVPAESDYNARIESGYRDTLNSANQYAESVTMIQLISNPEQYDGKLVRVIGVGNLEFEGNYISLDKEDWQYCAGNSIWIELGERAIPYEEAKQYNGEYVIIEGIFDKDFRGHLNMFYGSIINISRYDLWDVERTTAE